MSVCGTRILGSTGGRLWQPVRRAQRKRAVNPTLHGQEGSRSMRNPRDLGLARFGFKHNCGPYVVKHVVDEHAAAGVGMSWRGLKAEAGFRVEVD